MRLHGLSYKDKSCLVQLRLWGDSWSKQSLSLKGSVVGALRPLVMTLPGKWRAHAVDWPIPGQRAKRKTPLKNESTSVHSLLFMKCFSLHSLTPYTSRKGQAVLAVLYKGGRRRRALKRCCKGPLASATATFCFPLNKCLGKGGGGKVMGICLVLLKLVWIEHVKCRF